jgi:hypothetical protein
VSSPPELPKTRHVHDGFYLRLGAGPLYARTSLRTDRVSQPDVTVRGLGGGGELWIGGTPRPGVSVGGVLGGSRMTSDEAKVGSHGKAPATVDTTLVGAFIDAYPDPEQGYHFGGLLAGAVTDVNTEAAGELAATKYSGAGLALSVFAGLDTWVAEQWSFGVLLRLGGSLGREETRLDAGDSTKQGVTYAAQVLVNLLYH